MLSNSFWYGFAIGLGLVTLVCILPWLVARVRSKKDSDS
jgi:tetrahydromethanopterin S-methyltransferase subunit B